MSAGTEENLALRFFSDHREQQQEVMQINFVILISLFHKIKHFRKNLMI